MWDVPFAQYLLVGHPINDLVDVGGPTGNFNNVGSPTK